MNDHVIIIYVPAQGIGFLSSPARVFSAKHNILRLIVRHHTYEDCINKIKHLTRPKLIIILAHGRSDALLMPSEGINDAYEAFIDSRNIDIFKGHNILCISCNSNAKIAEIAIRAGVLSWIGFGDNNFAQDYLCREAYKRDKKVISEAKFCFREIIFKLLERNIQCSSTAIRLVDDFEFLVNQKIYFLKTQNNILSAQRKHYIIAYLEQLKYEIIAKGAINKPLIAM